MTIARWSLRRVIAIDDALIAGLADVLVDCVEGGASVSFMSPLGHERAELFWRDVAKGVAAGQCALLVAEDRDGVCGSVQLVIDLPENQPHRADVAKLLVHRRARAPRTWIRVDASSRRCGTQVWENVAGPSIQLRMATPPSCTSVWVGCASATSPDTRCGPHGGLCDTTVFYRNLEEPNEAKRNDATAT